MSTRVDPSNTEAARAWDGGDGDFWAAHADRFDASLGGYDEPLFAAAAIGVSDHVLDIGCGTGQTTREAARRAPGGTALGVDLSSAMLAVARVRAAGEGLANVSFAQADAQIHPFAPRSIDVAVSRTGAMFFGDPVAAFGNIAAALRPGGRLVLVVWQPAADNPWLTELVGALAAGRELPAPPPDAPGPFALSDPHRVRAVLCAAGYQDITVTGVRAPMRWGTEVGDTVDFMLSMGFSQFLLRDLDPAGRTRAEAALRDSVAAHHNGSGVTYPSACWLVTAVRP